MKLETRPAIAGKVAIVTGASSIETAPVKFAGYSSPLPFAMLTLGFVLARMLLKKNSKRKQLNQ
ncbi:MAG: hypothetical protein L0287_01850 [Anaerolineae bacterium]|nr:hypothetical protein [Anaerolineae bacterium]MCI0607471.1 hypothetical protein [Anaerolineae bacterium]